MSETLLVSHSGIARLTLNRPKMRNAFNTRLMEAMCARVAEIKDRRGAKALIITGAGSAFSSGRDLKESASHTKAQAARFMRLGERWSAALRQLPVPTIAAVNGPAFGWGMVLMLVCDIRIAAQDAVFGYPETALGVFPGGDATVRLARQIFPPAAKELVLTGRRFGAGEAYRLGLVNRLAPKERLPAEAEGLAREIAGQPAGRLRAAKAAFVDAEAMTRYGNLPRGGAASPPS